MKQGFFALYIKKMQGWFFSGLGLVFLVGFLVKQRPVYYIRGAVFFGLKQKLTKI
jgi:hypothetical protein